MSNKEYKLYNAKLCLIIYYSKNLINPKKIYKNNKKQNTKFNNKIFFKMAINYSEIKK